MGTWGTGIYQNDSALDYFWEVEEVVQKMWMELGIHVDAEQFDNGEWFISAVYTKDKWGECCGWNEIIETYLLVWADIVLKLNIVVTYEQLYATVVYLNRGIRQLQEDTDIVEDWKQERIKILTDIRNRLKKDGRYGDMFLKEGLGIKKENEEWKEERKRQQKQRRKEELEARRQNGEKLGYGKRRETNNDEELDKE